MSSVGYRNYIISDIGNYVTFVVIILTPDTFSKVGNLLTSITDFGHNYDYFV